MISSSIPLYKDAISLQLLVRDLLGIKKYIPDNGNQVLENDDDSMQNISEGTNFSYSG